MVKSFFPLDILMREWKYIFINNVLRILFAFTPMPSLIAVKRFRSFGFNPRVCVKTSLSITVIQHF